MTRTAWAAAPLVALALVACSDDVGLGQLTPGISVDELVDFGSVPLGIEKKVELLVRNEGTGTLTVSAVVPGEAFSTGAYSFKVSSQGFDVASKSETRVVVRFQPYMVSGDQPYESRFEIQTTATDGSGSPISRTVVVRGRGVTAAIEVAPNPLDFGAVLAGSSRTLNVRITNTLSDPITLNSESNGQGSPVVRQLGGDGRFTVMASLNAAGALMPGDGTLAPGASIEVPIRYEPNPIPTMASDDAQWIISTCADDLCKVTIRLIGRSTDNAIACTPMAIDFGAVNPGRTLGRTITCTNVASDTVTIGPWSLEPGSDPSYAIAPFAGTSTLAPGAAYTVDVTFTPTEAQLQNRAMPLGRAVFSALGSTGRPLMPIHVPLSGRAGGPSITVTPEELHFGGIAIGTTRARRFVIVNDGYEDLVVSDVAEGAAMTGDFFALPTVLVVPSGTSTVVEVTFAPSTEGPIVSSIVVSSNDAVTPQLSLLADGVGVRLPPCQYTVTPAVIQAGLTYVGQTSTAAAAITNIGTDICLINDLELSATSASNFTLVAGPETGIMLAPGGSKTIAVSFTATAVGPAQAEVTMYISDPLQSNLVIPVTGVGGAITEVLCPPAQTVAAGNPVTLSAMGMVIGRNISGYTWTIVSAPNGGVGTPNQWTPNPPTTPTVSFLPYIVGVYVLEVTVFDDVGGSAVCQTSVTAEGHGLRVTMTWDGPGDVDLHLHRPQSTQPWFNGTDDCFYSARTPIWDAMSPPSVGANPELDFDNTSANGPENTTVDIPIINVDYTIGVHNFGGAAGRLVTIEVYCGNGVVPSATLVSRPLAGVAGGNCSANDFWSVASVSFQSLGACTVTPIDTYRPSSEACVAF